MGYIERLEGYKDDMIRTLRDSVAIPSVKSEAVKTSDGELLPFGRGVHDSMMHFLGVAATMGFESHNVDNYAGYVDYKASEEYASEAKNVAVVGHLDVVPVGTGWTGDPFEMFEKDGCLYGRGTADDKGPAVAVLYALKAIKDEGIPFKNNLRIILGLDEETGDISIKYYTDRYGHPDMGFTPDGDFPIVNGEMGIMVFDLAQKFSANPAKDDLRLTKMTGGLAHNAVPADAKAVIAGDRKYFDAIAEKAKLYAAETGYNVSTKKQGNSLAVEVKGKAAHGAHPELGINAISIMMDFLGRVKFANEELNDYIAFYNEHLGFDLHGERFGIKFEDNQSGPLILNVGVANINEELASVSVNIRYPVTFTDVELATGMEKCLDDSSVGIITRMVQEPIYMELSSDMVSKLLAAYREETGDYETPAIVQAGGTYAKMVNNILCYGGMFPGEEDTMHQADERLSVDSFMKMARIYARAIYSLCCE